MLVIRTLLVILAFSVFGTSCSEGPAEKNGKKVDKAVEKVQDTINPKGPAQKAGEKIDDATGN